MNTKWKIILLVMLTILSVSSVFLYFYVKDNRTALNQLIEKDISKIQEIIKTLEEENHRHYKNRIAGLVDYKTFPNREKMVRAFALRNRGELLQFARPFANRFLQENPNFSSFGWITQNNIVCTRVLAPHKYGDDISTIRPDIVEANRTQEPIFGYMTAPNGLEPRLVQPVSYKGKPIGVVQFGLSESMLIDIIHEKMGTAVAMVIPNKKFSIVKESKLPRYSTDKFTVQSHQLDFFKQFSHEVNWESPQQRLIINDKELVLARAIELLNFKGEPEGYIFVILDITGQIQRLNARISFIVFLTGGLLLISFLIIYPSYGSLVQKIVTLNRSLEESNLTLEDRVQERTGELQESEKRFKEVLDHSPLGILISDQTIMNIYYANPAICSMLGYTQSELEKMNIESIHRSADFPQILQRFKSNRNQKNGLIEDIPFLKNGGSVFDADIHSSHVKFEGHDCLIGFIIDLTEKKKLEKHLRRTNKMEAIGLMAGGVAHDLNNVLAAIISYPELMLRKLSADHPMKRQLEEIQASGQRAAGIVNDLLTIARGVRVNKEAHDLHPLIQEYIASAEYKNLSTSHPQINCEFKCEAGSSIIDCSPLHFSKILMNLIANAFEAIDESGQVMITTTNVRLDRFNNFDGSVPPGDYLLLKIKDSGSGIAAKDLEHIFEPFYSTKMMGQSGTGLGLSMVWNIVKDHNGHISVSTTAKGTTFELVFPVSENPVVENRQDSADKFEYQGSNEHILIVDDELQLRDLTSELLSSLNYTVTAVCSGEEAIAVIQEKDFDLVIIDMQMGAGMNGRQTIEKIKTIKAETKVIIASGYSESQEVAKALKIGAISFVNKPYTLSQLGKAVTDALGKI